MAGDPRCLHRGRPWGGDAVAGAGTGAQTSPPLDSEPPISLDTQLALIHSFHKRLLRTHCVPGLCRC